MRKLVSFLKLIRRNWKKTTLGVLSLSYAADYGNVKYNNRQLMREYCLAASKFGDVTLTKDENPYRMVVILNPAANRKKARKDYENYCAPLLHISGIHVTVLVTNGESGARDIVQSLPENIDGIIIAGGDGTISEVVTGLLRSADGNILVTRKIPIGILPLGQTNLFAKKLYNCKKHISEVEFPRASYTVRLLAEAAFTIIENKSKLLDIIQIENITDGNCYKPVYALSGIDWGAFQVAHSSCNKYWYFGSFRSYIPYILGYNLLNKPVKATVRYTLPCDGCRNCYQSTKDLLINSNVDNFISNKRWWQIWKSTNSNEKGVDYSNIENPSCSDVKENTVDAVSLSITLPPFDSSSKLIATIGPSVLSYFDFVKDGWRKERGKSTLMETEVLEAKQIDVEPTFDTVEEGKFKLVTIDNEDYEIQKMKVTLLRNAVKVFCPVNE